jgi:hypothetical protein
VTPMAFAVLRLIRIQICWAVRSESVAQIIGLTLVRAEHFADSYDGAFALIVPDLPDPSARKPCTKALPTGIIGSRPAICSKGVELKNQPIRKTLPSSCARAASGHVAVPLSRVMNSRRLTISPHLRETAYHALERKCRVVPKTDCEQCSKRGVATIRSPRRRLQANPVVQQGRAPWQS